MSKLKESLHEGMLVVSKWRESTHERRLVVSKLKASLAAFSGVALMTLSPAVLAQSSGGLKPAFCAEVDRLPGTPSEEAQSACGGFMKRVFVTEDEFSPDLGGLAGADVVCNDLAQGAGLPGQYRAWLSDDETSANDRFTHASIPYATLDGAIVADDYADLTDGTIDSPIDITENGTLVDGGGFTIFAWTGTNGDGSSQPGRNCNGWTDATNAFSALSGVIDPFFLAFPNLWTAIQNNSCAGFGSDHLYCIQQ